MSQNFIKLYKNKDMKKELPDSIQMIDKLIADKFRDFDALGNEDVQNLMVDYGKKVLEYAAGKAQTEQVETGIGCFTEVSKNSILKIKENLF